MRKPFISTFLALVIGAASASATVTISFEFATLRDSSGTTLADEAYMLVADTDGDGLFPTASELLNASVTTGSTIGGDYVFYTGALSGGVASSSVSGINYATLGVVTNDRWAIFWFPTLNVGDTITSGASYGWFQSSLIDQGVEDVVGFTLYPMTFQADGFGYDSIYYDSPSLVDVLGGTPTGNTPSVSQFSANFNVVPEPSSALLGMLGLSAAVLRRRR